MFERILIATDNSPLMKNAMVYTGKAFPYADYHLINVINTSDGSIPNTPMVQRHLKEISTDALRKGKKILENIGVENVKLAMPSGTPSKQIMKYTTKNKIDLMVMATHSKTGAQKVHIGETTLSCLEFTHIPSLVFACNCKPRIPKKIFNPTTFSTYSVYATICALELAAYFGASLTVYYIGKEEPGAAERRIKRKALEEGVPYTLIDAKSPSDEDILKQTKKYDFMVGSRGRKGILYKLRYIFPTLALSSLEKELIAETEIPFLMVGD
ncbi:MAG: universal stress protein [Thermoplasmata archaeon]